MASSVWKRIVERGIAMLFNEEDGVSVPVRTRSAVKRRTAVDADPRTIHRVRQAFTTSCGVAAVGMFARVSHEEALRVMFPKPRRVYYTHYTDVKRALDHFGVRHGGKCRRFSSWDEISTTALVKVRCRGEGGRIFHHWVIFQKRETGAWRVLDPDPTSQDTQSLSRAALARYTPLTYLTVEPVPPRSEAAKSRRAPKKAGARA